MPTVTVNIPNTTFISSSQPDSNFSFFPLIYTGTDPGFSSCTGLLRISLPELPVNQVDSAFLQLSVIVKSGASPSPVVVNEVTSSFDPSTVTYNTRPDFSPTASTISISTADLYTAVKIDVTALVNGWLNGTVPNNGIALTNADGVTIVEFATNNIVYEPYFPELVLTYSSTPSEDTALCFSYAQLANVITQLIRLYPAAIMNIYTKGFNAASISGPPAELYASPDATYGTLFVLNGGDYGAVPLNTITAIGLPQGTVYDPSITYLPTPAFPAGCDKNLITAYHDYLPVSTPVTMYMGTVIQTAGVVYKNEYGLLVLADDMQGTNPVFIPVINITAIVTSTQPDSPPDAQSDKAKLLVVSPGTSPTII